MTTPDMALPDALYRAADPGYFSALQIPLLKGRFFVGEDRIGHPKTVIVSQQLAQQYFPGENPLGKHLHIFAYGDADYEIVGVVADTLYQVGQPSKPTMYFPIFNGQSGPGGAVLIVRTASDPLASAVPIQKQIAELDPELPVSDVLTMQQIIERLGQRQLERESGTGLRGVVVDAGVGRIVRGPLLPYDAAHWGDRCSPGPWRTTRSGCAPDAGRRFAAGDLWSGAWPCSQRRSSTPDRVDALRNPAARSSDLCGCGCNSAAGGSAGLPHAGVEGVADRSDAGIANGIGLRICASW